MTGVVIGSGVINRRLSAYGKRVIRSRRSCVLYLYVFLLQVVLFLLQAVVFLLHFFHMKEMKGPIVISLLNVYRLID